RHEEPTRASNTYYSTTFVVEPELFVYELGVAESHRRQGIAKALMQRIRAYCQEQKIAGFFLGTALDNEPARELYRALGGKEELQPWYEWEVQ
ncbi:MAG: GNAT family N-acetyltransferase, partial [Bacteroidota bacterium]